ncbi:MAG: phenylacetate-CoA oxygenase subunit PaaJ [Pseudomonadota bacterium]|nr:phenylacetate-CoA oxygenase subunit PaaJ [Pseudomonadota bacterium]
MSTTEAATILAQKPGVDAIWRAVAAVPDPEIPVISVVDLGIIRDVEWRNDEWVISVTPTYSGCPATEVIAADIGRALIAAGVAKFRIETRLAPPWTTDWIAPGARKRLADYGIAPPSERGAAPGSSIRIDISALRRNLADQAPVACPRCHSLRTREQSRYGSTPCKAQYRCDECLEPFDYFKPH